MEELAVKKDFTDIYTQKFPNEYLKEMKRLDYRIPDKTKPLYLSIAKQLYKKFSKTINIIDIGSSYGINSALMQYDLKMSELDDFFLEQEPTIEQSKQFFENLSSDDTLDFYQIDISEPHSDSLKIQDFAKKEFVLILNQEIYLSKRYHNLI